MFTMVNKNI